MILTHIKSNPDMYRHILLKDSLPAAPGLGVGNEPWSVVVGGIQIPPRIIEYCADEDSNIGMIADPNECEVIRLTKRHDVCSKVGRKRAMRAIKTRAATFLWGSMPCTGGSTRAPQNLAKGGSAADTVMMHRDLFESIWYNFEKVATLTVQRGGRLP